MAEKHWYMSWTVNDWLTDASVSVLKESTRGIWMDALCCMFLQDRCGQLVGTIVDLARLCRTTPNAMRAAVDDIRDRNAGDVVEQNGIVTLTNRRMRREWEYRKSARERKLKQRSKSVTPNVTHDVTQLSHSSIKSHSNSQRRKKESAGADWPAGMAALWDASPPWARERSSRKQVFDEWQSQGLEPNAAQVVASLEAWKRSRKWTDEGGKATEGLHIWLKNRKWQESPGTTTNRDPVQSAAAAKQDAATRSAAASELRHQLERDREKNVAILRALPPDELADLKRRCVEAADPKFRKQMEEADPLAANMLGSLMVTRLGAEKMEKAGAA